MRRIPFVLQGDFTEFLQKELGYKKWEPPLSVMPLEPITLAYSKVEFLPRGARPSGLENPITRSDTHV